MAEAGYSSISALLTEDYKEIYDTLNDEVPVLRELERSTKIQHDRIDGKYAVHGLRVGRNESVSHQLSTDDLPTAGRQTYQRTEIPLRIQTGRGQLNITLFRNLGKQGTIDAADTVMAELDGLMGTLQRDRGRIVFGTGDGRIAQCGLSSNSTTISLSNATETEMLQLEEMAAGTAAIDIGTVASPAAQADGVTLTAGGVDVAAKTITVSSASTTTAAHYVFRKDSGGDTDGSFRFDDGQKEATGLRRIVDDGTNFEPTGGLYNVDPATYSTWAAGVYDNSGNGNRPFTEQLLLNAAMQQSRKAAGNKLADFYVTGLKVYLEIVEHLSSLRRNIENITRDKGGTSGIKWDVVGAGGNTVEPIICWDRDCPEKQIFGLSLEDLVYYEDPEGLSLFDYDGNQFSRVSNKLSVEFTAVGLWELAPKVRNSHFVLKDIEQS